MEKLPSLSIFYPAYNDDHTIGNLIRQAYLVGKNITTDLEVIIINDGSRDDTGTVLEKLKRDFKELKIITHAVNQGYGAALRDGFNGVTKEFIFYTDGDGQYNPEEIVKLVECMNNSVDIVNGFKLDRKDSIIRKVAGDLYNILLRKIYGLPVRDVDCDFRLIRRSTLNKIRLQSSSGMICLELIVKLKNMGARFEEIGVYHYERKYGRSQFFTPKNLLKTFIDHVNFFLSYKKGTI